MQWKAEITSISNGPELDYMNDPDDYLRVRGYAVDDLKWKTTMPGSSCAAAL